MNEPQDKKSISAQEEEILKFWQEHKIFEKSLEQRKGAEEFVFYDGPPFATGLPHYGHLMQSFAKDTIPRYQTMRGKFVSRRWGWDCHGLPLENLIEKELGLFHKKDIEEYGVAKFNKAAETAVLRYADDWKRIIPRIGRWVDMEHDYKTMDSMYTESVWWVFKTLHEKGLIEEGYKSMHLCPRCETTLANFEVSQGYKDIKDIAVTVMFELVDEPGTYLLAWTTTPWTLPGNIALAIGQDIQYVKARVLPRAGKDVAIPREYFVILAKDILREISLEETAQKNFIFEGYRVEIIDEFKGSDLVGKKYKPLFDYYAKDETLKNRENGWKIYAADFVTTNEGTGIVHIASAFGEEDMALGKKENLPFVQHVAVDGTFKPEVKDFAGLLVKPKDPSSAKATEGTFHQSTDVEIIKHLDACGLLFKKEAITHSYPHCWRCETPLLNYAANSWFVIVTKIKDTLIAANKEINWMPPHLKEGRFGKGLETAPDWAISRSRYWGAPLPVWRCETCKNMRVIGSLAELEEKRARPRNTFLLMRHGERQDILHEKDNQKDYDPVVVSSNPEANVHLSERGRQEIEALAKKIKEDGGANCIYASDFIRTRETAEILSKILGAPVVYDARLRELHHGTEFEGRTVAEYRAFFISPEERFTKKPKGGETLNDVRRRMMSILHEIDKAREGKRIFIVSHGDPLWILEGALTNASQENMLKSSATNYIKQGELRAVELNNWPYDEEGRLNLHRPYIDMITLACVCGGIMKRIPEVFDCWFESGSMPYGQHHYMGKPVEGFNPQLEEGLAFRSSKSVGGFPADFIAESVEMTRGWFYSLHVLASALFEKPAFSAVLATGTILAEDGRKMSKHLRNYPDPMELVERYGADALRMYIFLAPVMYGENMNFSEKGVDEISKKIISRLSNVYSFYELYSSLDSPLPNFADSAHALDTYITYELTETATKIERALDEYELAKAARAADDFSDILSTVYLQFSRDRFKGDAKRRAEALSYFRYALAQFAKIIAPLMPFLAESLYQRVKYGDAKESVHLEDWPTFPALPESYKESWRNIQVVRLAVEHILAARSAAGIPVRQPLASARVKELPKDKEYQNIIMERTNVEQIEEDVNVEAPAWIDITSTPELKEKGMLREFIRGVQATRKKEGLKPGDRIKLHICIEGVPKDFFEKHEEGILKAVDADSLEFIPEEGIYEINLGNDSVSVSIISAFGGHNS